MNWNKNKIYLKKENCVSDASEADEYTFAQAKKYNKNSIKNALSLNDQYIDLLPTLCYNKVGNTVGDKTSIKLNASRKNGLNNTRKIILSEMRHNPNITKKELAVFIGISETAIDNSIKYLKQNGYIERIRPNKDGCWKVLK